jgi:hypothetical protein
MTLNRMSVLRMTVRNFDKGNDGQFKKWVSDYENYFTFELYEKKFSNSNKLFKVLM